MSEITVLFLIIAVVIVLFVSEKVPVVLVALGTALALYFTGILDLSQALGGLGDSTTIFIASLFVVSAGLEVTGVTAWAGQLLISKAGDSRVRQIVLIMLLCSLLTALISLNGSVAALLPVVVVMAVQLKRPPSQLLMPMVFASHAGSILALTGSPVNVLVSEAAAGAGTGYFGFFEFTIAGIPLLFGTMVILVLLGPRLLPSRGGASMPADLTQHARTLVEQYRLDSGLFQLRLRPSSPLIGTAPGGLDLGAYPGLNLIGLQAGATGRPLTRQAFAAGDTIIVKGDAEVAASLANMQHLAFGSDEREGNITDMLFNRSSGLAEVVIPPRSALIGREVFPGMVTESGDLLILAVQRNGENLPPGKAQLAAGDSLLLQGTWSALDKRLADPEVLVVDSPDLVRRQAVPMGAGAKSAITILADGPGAGDRRRALGDRRLVVRGRDGAAARPDRRPGLPVGQLDHGDSRRRNDAAIGGDGANRRGPANGRPSGGDRRRGGPLCIARGPVPVDRDPRTADQQHCHRADHHSNRRRRRARARGLAATGVDDRMRGGSRFVPDARCNTREPDDHGPGRLQVRRLLEAGSGLHGVVLRRCGVHRSARLEALARRARGRTRHLWAPRQTCSIA